MLAIDGEYGVRRGNGHAIAVDELNLVFRLPRSVIVARPHPEHGVVVEPRRRPRESQARAEIALRAVVPRPVWIQVKRAGVHIEVREQIAVLAQHGVVLVAHSVTHRETWTNLPLILDITDVVCLLEESIARDAIVQWVRGAHVADDSNAGRFVVEEVVEVRESVGRSAEAVRIHPDRPDFHAELEGVILFHPAQLVRERESVVRVRHGTSVLRAVGTN